MEIPIIAIDGPSGVGKSTVARRLAGRLGLPMLDTGATYRALALKVLRQEVDPDHVVDVVKLAETTNIDLRPTADGTGLEVFLDGQPVESFIRTSEVSDATSRISAHSGVRRRLVELQRRVAARHGAVVEGRDIGTVVFPDTPYKFFLTADPAVRADRRFREIAAGGIVADRAEVQSAIERRDARDSSRPDSPLRYDDTYTVIDTSRLSPEEIVERMVAVIEPPR